MKRSFSLTLLLLVRVGVAFARVWRVASAADAGACAAVGGWRHISLGRGTFTKGAAWAFTPEPLMVLSEGEKNIRF